MALLYTSHGLVWKSHGCSGSGEHDPFAGEIVELALRIERSAQQGAHRAFNLFEEWRCEACSWNHNALYTLWTTDAPLGEAFQPLDAIDDHRAMHERADQGSGPATARGPRYPQQRRQHPAGSQRLHRRATRPLDRRRPAQRRCRRPLPIRTRRPNRRASLTVCVCPQASA